jgi:Bacterial extracellular solute-binding proteins, family 3
MRLWAMCRFMLLAVGGLLGLMAHAQAQSQPSSADTARKGELRVLAIARAPLADEQLPEGGLILSLLRASLSTSGADGFEELALRWTKAAATPPQIETATVDIVLPLEGADCDQPNDLTQALAVLCDAALFSEPLLQVVVALFAPSDSTFSFDTDEGIFGKTVCVAQDHDVSVLNGAGRSWVALKRVAVLRHSTLIECVAAVQGRAADAFVATDLEGRYVLDRLGLKQAFKMQARPVATRGVHAAVPREHAKGAEVIAAIDRGLKQLKQSDAYAAIVQKHLTSLWDSSAQQQLAAGAAAGPKLPPQPAATAQPVLKPQPPKAPPVLTAVERERAMRFMKKGDEELQDGRVAPARLLYERAADIGLAQAAMALAATFDAVELGKLNLRNVQANATEAKRWDERALALGADDASQRLRRLGAKQ